MQERCRGKRENYLVSRSGKKISASAV